MKKSYWIILFLLALLINIIAICLKDEWLERASKPLLMILLIIYFLSATKGLSSGLKKWIVAALFFSWLGDVLLMFQESDSIFFLLGLSSFLIAHIFYIGFFHHVKSKEGIKSRWWLPPVITVYYAVLMAILFPHLGDMKIPVAVYGFVISFMLLLALHMLFMQNKRAGRWMMTGSLLFVASDSVLAMNKFYQSFEPAGVIIMLTYGLAQLFLTEGASRYLRSVNSN